MLLRSPRYRQLMNVSQAKWTYSCNIVVCGQQNAITGRYKMKKRFSTEFTPRFSDFDAQGILNSKQYLDFLTEARMDQMIRCYLVPMDTYHKRSQTWVFSTFSIKFYKP